VGKLIRRIRHSSTNGLAGIKEGQKVELGLESGATSESRRGRYGFKEHVVADTGGRMECEISLLETG